MTGRARRSGDDPRPGRGRRDSARRAARASHLHAVESGPSARRGDYQTQDLFAWGARQKRFRESGSISVRRTLPSPSAARASRHARRQDPRLGEYLYSGSFGRLAPERRDASVQRNRVLFSILLACLTLYVVVHLVSD